MKKVFVRLSGGLGNQLFQLSAVYFSNDFCNLTEVILDTRFLNTYETSRDFELDFILRHLPYVKIKTQQSGFCALASTLRLGKFINRSIGCIAFVGTVSKLRSVRDKSISWLILDGYFQHPDIFFDNKIRKFLFRRLASEFSYLRVNLNLPITSGLVSVHIRRGDFVTSKAASNVFKTVPLNYYREAVRSFPSTVVFLVFGDDRSVVGDFAKEIEGIDAGLLELTLKEEFMFMALCDHHIISNSTFSWCASQFGDPAGKRVIAPRDWYVNTRRSRTNPLLLPNFELLSSI